MSFGETSAPLARATTTTLICFAANHHTRNQDNWQSADRSGGEEEVRLRQCPDAMFKHQIGRLMEPGWVSAGLGHSQGDGGYVAASQEKLKQRQFVSISRLFSSLFQSE